MIKTTHTAAFTLLFFCAVKIVLQAVILHPDYNLHRDEFLHLDQAAHLAAGYISVPPFSSWLALLIKPFGPNENLVHLLPALVGTLTLIVVWKTVEALGGSLIACCLAATAIVASMLLRINMLFQPNSVDVLAWTTVYFGLIKYLKTEKNGWLYFTAACLALGFLNKYNIVFLAAGIGAALLLTPQRKIFWNKHFWRAALLALVVVAPNLWWQYNHHFPVVWHMRELSSTQLVNVKTSQFLLEQVLFFFGGFYLIVAALIALVRSAAFTHLRFVLYSFFIVLGLFVALHAKGYYAVGLYPTLLAIGAAYVGKGIAQSQYKSWWLPALMALNVILFLPPFFAVFPVLPPQQAAAESSRFKAFGLLTWEDGKEHHLPQDFADMLGWQELAQKVDALYNKVGDKNTLLVLCDNYGQTGAINYYSKNKNINAVSFNADYLQWFPVEKNIKSIISVCDKDEAPVEPGEIKLFSSITLMDSINNPLAREYGTKIYLLSAADTAVTALLRRQVTQRRTH